mmetsp:Transcript_10434/g.10054  ORF Transcript_10434/g.10054 Transcript_10434/m.10054 type:complete len:509 (+) Transcript_10434:255-1781(+)|eukprot:CAMPEP_0119038670 /NCGR_PEP_ID=MMETSP1177-20130426/7729_1 /TAXON_ID=2985 /ORGANISM="Ochromonas sp, Strain CCMP1899" /LENGTH=508 /DNA_ID=CAMNT_0007001557 /DNA_START=172 /DNA_END=1698 /DNA_ORIENTATION=-
MLAWMSKKSDIDETEVASRASSLCGFLWKMKRTHQKRVLIPQWNKRWFSIEGRLLKWYAGAGTEKSSGMIDLRFITNVCAFEASGVFSFIISYPDRNLLLRATNEKEMYKWIRALQFQADVARGGCGMTIVTENNSSCSSPQGKGRAEKKKYRPPTLEANLEATMVRLQILENNVLKQSGKGGSFNEGTMYDDGVGPEDVNLSDGERESRDVTSKKHASKRNFRDGGSDNECRRENKGSRSHRDDGRKRNSDDDEEDLFEYEHRDMPARSSNIHKSKSVETYYSNQNNRHGRTAMSSHEDSTGSRLSSQERESKTSTGDDSMEEIMPVPRVRSRGRDRGRDRVVSQVQGHREREKDRVKGRDDDNGSKDYYDNDRDFRNGGGASSGMPPPARHGNWGYDNEDIFRQKNDFEGGVNLRQNHALKNAATKMSKERSGNFKNDHCNGNSTRNSYMSRTTSQDDDYDEDLPEMDLTVRRPPQRAARERKQKEHDRAEAERNTANNTSGNGWV